MSRMLKEGRQIATLLWPRQKEFPVELTSEQHTPSFNYESHTKNVVDHLMRFGFGETATLLTGDTIGIDRERYLSFARQRLLDPESTAGVDQKVLPEKIGEVEIPPLLRTHGHNISALLLSFNVGYGHLRPALALQNVIELLGGKARSAFLGGEENSIPHTGKTDFGGYKDLNRLLRGVGRWYRVTNLTTAHQQGMMDQPPTFSNPDPEYTQLAKTILGFVADRETFKKAPEKAIAEVMTFLRERTRGQVWASSIALSLLFRRSLRTLIQNSFHEERRKEKLVIATHGTIGEALGTIHPLTKQRIGYVDANFQPDVCMFYDTYTQNPHTYTEKNETVEKWGMKQGFHNGEHARNTIVLDGYITPLSVFKREQLAETRRQALESGIPLTVVATASGNAPAQLGAFKDFIITNLPHFADKTLRMVVECGAEEGGGLIVHDQLHNLIKKYHLEESVVLHASKTPEASLQFFEAVSWAPVPIAMLVKASEMTRIAQALNVPLISTGALGPHELWNIAATLLDNPTSVVFSQKVGAIVRDGILKNFPNDMLVQQHPERRYIERLVENLSTRTAQNAADLLQLVRDHITGGRESSSNQQAMLTLLSDMLDRKNRKGFFPLRRGKHNE